jgi:uncharacterized protein
MAAQAAQVASFPAEFTAGVKSAAARRPEYPKALIGYFKEYAVETSRLPSPQAVREFLAYSLSRPDTPGVPAPAAAALMKSALERPAEFRATVASLDAAFPGFAARLKSAIAGRSVADIPIASSLRAALAGSPAKPIDDSRLRAFFDGTRPTAYEAVAGAGDSKPAPSRPRSRLARAPAVWFKSGNAFEKLSPREFERRFGVRYLARLSDLPVPPQARDEHENARRKAEGYYVPYADYRQGFQAELDRGAVADLYLTKISDKVGHGVFAKSALEAGQWVGEYTGAFQRMGARTEPQWHDNGYLFNFPFRRGTRHHALDARKTGNITRFINHSAKRGNLEFVYVFHDDGLCHIVFLAKRRIEAGEQLLFDYGEGYWEHLGLTPDEL